VILPPTLSVPFTGGSGEKNAAFEWLEKAFQQHEGFLVELKVYPMFDDLHGDQRVDALVKRIGILD
jgi:hypothetical protein